MTRIFWDGLSYIPDRVTIQQDEDLWVELELLNYGVFPFIHIQIYKWSPRVYRKCLEILLDVLQNYPYVYAEVHDDKIRRFAEGFGFIETPNHVITTDGVRRDIMIVGKDLIPGNQKERLQCHRPQ